MPLGRSGALLLLALAACAHKPPARETFHYRTAAHPLAPGGAWTAALDADSTDHFAEASRFHLAQRGVLKLTMQPGASTVAIFVYGAGKKPLVQTRSTQVTTPAVEGDVFVVVRALKGDGLIRISSAFEPLDASASGTPTLGNPVPMHADPAPAAAAPMTAEIPEPAPISEPAPTRSPRTTSPAAVSPARAASARSAAAKGGAPFPMDDEPDTLGSEAKAESGKSDGDDLSLDGL